VKRGDRKGDKIGQKVYLELGETEEAKGLDEKML
jgi:hypothetical protein